MELVLWWSHSSDHHCGKGQVAETISEWVENMHFAHATLERLVLQDIPFGKWYREDQEASTIALGNLTSLEYLEVYWNDILGDGHEKHNLAGVLPPNLETLKFLPPTQPSDVRVDCEILVRILRDESCSRKLQKIVFVAGHILSISGIRDLLEVCKERGIELLDEELPDLQSSLELYEEFP